MRAWRRVVAGQEPEKSEARLFLAKIIAAAADGAPPKTPGGHPPWYDTGKVLTLYERVLAAAQAAQRDHRESRERARRLRPPGAARGA